MKKTLSSDACRRFRANLSDVVDRTATDEQVADVDEHREGCAECAMDYQLATRMGRCRPELLAAGAVSEPLGSFASALAELEFDPTEPVELALTCPEFCAMVGDFVSEELSVDAMLECVHHASHCRPCEDELSAAQSMQELLRSMGNQQPPANLFAKLMARIDAEESADAEPATRTVKKLAPVRKLAPLLG